MRWNLARRFAKSRITVTALVGMLLGPLGGCVHHVPSASTPSVHGRSHGPPSHAPAHGHRHKRHHDGVELVFDAGLGVYVVVDQPGHYWHADRYLRWAAGEWSVSYRVDGDWVVVASDAVPQRLVGKYAKRHKKAKHHHKHGWPAKRGH
jgi:hypothetical protein